MNISEERATTLRNINKLIDEECTNCTRKPPRRKAGMRGFASDDQFCNKKCDIGRKLQDLGKELIASVNKRNEVV